MLRPIASALTDAGSNETRTEYRHADAERLDLWRKPFRHCNDRELACGVGAEPHAAHHSCHRRSVDEVSTLIVRAHMGQKRPGAVKHAHQIDVEHPFPAIERNVIDAAARSDAGIVADDVNILEGVVGLLARTIDARRIGDVADDAAHAGSDIVQAFHGVGQSIGFDVGKHHVHAGFRKCAAHRKADAACTTGHKSCLAGQVFHTEPSIIPST